MIVHCVVIYNEKGELIDSIRIGEYRTTLLVIQKEM